MPEMQTTVVYIRIGRHRSRQTNRTFPGGIPNVDCDKSETAAVPEVSPLGSYPRRTDRSAQGANLYPRGANR